MWKGICQRLSEKLNSDFNHCTAQLLQVPCSSAAYLLQNQQHQLFIKLGKPLDYHYFAAEHFSLLHLAEAQCIDIPKPILLEKHREHSLIALPYLAFSSASERQWLQLGQQLARLHQHTSQSQYGWQEDNYIGKSVQINSWQKRWDQFFAEQRIGYQLQLLKESGHSIGDIDAIVSNCRKLLKGHQPSASLLHGDLWSGNVGFTLSSGYIFDPACYYGDRETDLAMSELFGRFPPAFYQGYNAVWPVEKGYEYRKPLYQLYHLLNHAVMFGQPYLDSAKSHLVNLDV
ncbi:fructosamine kinase family protein [Neptunicella marina]|uniref:Fructosamine kinase family protein n=1 Tax=Neptunicella marina TaxID=2125989 RepID=A0A8J6IXK2_9ALTE|nr:fructosamine kinase family protein [Neptunicella marina]